MKRLISLTELRAAERALRPRKAAEAYILRTPPGVSIEYTRPTLLQRLARWLRSIR